MNEDIIKQKVQRVIVGCSVVLMAGKFAAFYLTNSVGILTDAMESIVNVVAGFISLYSLYQAALPKDAKHPFGRGKIELISASIEGILITIAGAFIIYEGVDRLFKPATIGKIDIGIIIIAAAGLVNYLLGWYSIRMGNKYDSIALVAGGKHLRSDTYSTIGLVVGLILLHVTSIQWIDGAMALVFGSIIIATGFGILRKTTANLMDEADKTYLEKMLHVVSEVRNPDWIDIHNLKMIKYGSYFYIDCDLTIPWYYTVEEGHGISDEFEKVVYDHFSERITLSAHLDPCGEKHCDHCQVNDCPYRKGKFRAPLEYTLEELTEPDDKRNE